MDRGGLNDEIAARAREALPTDPEGARCPVCGDGPADHEGRFWAPDEAHAHWAAHG